MSTERPTRPQIAAAQEISEAIERQQGGIDTVSLRLLSSWSRSLGVEPATTHVGLVIGVSLALQWIKQFDEKGNWIGTTAGENGWTP